jgi:hypothetical protein
LLLQAAAQGIAPFADQCLEFMFVLQRGQRARGESRLVASEAREECRDGDEPDELVF